MSCQQLTRVHTIGVNAQITVGHGPAGLAYDSGKGEIFVANYYTDTVSVISDSTNSVVATVTVGEAPRGWLMILAKAKSS